MMNTKTMKNCRKLAADTLAKAPDADTVCRALENMECSLRDALPEQARQALGAAPSTATSLPGNLVSVLRSKILLALRRAEKRKEGAEGEVGFQRQLIHETVEGSGWGNELVVWSGLAGPGAKLKGARIDLGCQSPDGRSVEFYELKLNRSAGREYEAIVELLSYVVGYLIARSLVSKLRQSEVSHPKRELLSSPRKGYAGAPERFGLAKAEKVTWSVIAPKRYYEADARQREIWKQGVDQYLTEAPTRFGVSDVLMDFSMKEMQFEGHAWKSALHPLSDFIDNALSLTR